MAAARVFSDWCHLASRGDPDIFGSRMWPRSREFVRGSRSLCQCRLPARIFGRQREHCGTRVINRSEPREARRGAQSKHSGRKVGSVRQPVRQDLLIVRTFVCPSSGKAAERRGQCVYAPYDLKTPLPNRLCRLLCNV